MLGEGRSAGFYVLSFEEKIACMGEKDSAMHARRGDDERSAMADELFTLREARDDDMGLINMYAYREGMPDIPGTEGVTVAVNADDQVIGFIRIKVGNTNNIAHINPVVVYAPWRRYGVGRALVEAALEREGELRLVSRGGSLAFYQALGFAEVPWGDIDPDIASECNGCELIDECKPTPVAKRIG